MVETDLCSSSFLRLISRKSSTKVLGAGKLCGDHIVKQHLNAEENQRLSAVPTEHGC